MLQSSPNLIESDSDQFYELVYEELRSLAASKMSKEFAYSTLQGTALVHEAWLKLGGEDQPRWDSRAHFFSAAAEAMRRILIDRARKRKRKRHGGELQRVDLEAIDGLSESWVFDDQIIQVNEALGKLEKLDPRKAELVKLRYFIGLSFEEAAHTMGISVTTTKRWWVFSKSWLYREIARS